MGPSFDEALLEAVSLWSVVLAGLLSALVLYRVDGDRRPLAKLRRRFLFGVPWGSIVVIIAVLAVYYLIQGGGKPGGPVVVGFRSWSFSYPVGMVLGPFAHSSDGHLFGNLFSTVAFAPIAEYAWSHYPRRRGSHSFGSLGTNPFVRIVVFVVAVFLVGLATSFLTPGALIGFSGVVFALAGYALVTRPVLAVFALVAEGVVRTLYLSVIDPVQFARGTTQFTTPYWADVAVQGHALGLFVGVLLGVVVMHRRDEWAGARRVWLAVLLFLVAKSLWAFYWYLGGTEYVLFRGFGVTAVLVLAVLVAVSVARTDRMLVARIDLSSRETAAGLILAAFLALSLVAVPYNLAGVSAGQEADSGVQVRDYTVTYAEEVPNRYIAAIEIPLLRDQLTVNTSGVIVTSDRRNAWEVAVPAQRLAVNGRAQVPVGGLGWRETVLVNRTSWSVIDGQSTYKVFVRRSGERRKQVFASDPVTVPAIVNRSRITIRPTSTDYEIAVRQNGTVVGSSPVPPAGGNVTVADIRFNRTGARLRAIYDGTLLPVGTFQQRTSRT